MLIDDDDAHFQAPKMGDGRLLKVSRVLTNHRKNTSNLNFIAKERLETERQGFARQQTLLGLRHSLNTRRVKQSLAELRGMQKVLKRRGERKNSTDVFGKYKGVRLHDLKPDVSQIIRENHPRERRRRETERMLTEGLENGKLIEMEQARQKFERIMAIPTPIPDIKRAYTYSLDDYDFDSNGRPYIGMSSREASRLILPPINAKLGRSQTNQPLNSEKRKPRHFVHVIPTAGTAYLFE